MNESILNTIKKLLGIAEDYPFFDLDIKTHINTVFSMMHSFGATPPNGYRIPGSSEKWSDFLNGITYLDMVQSYIFFEVRLMFDLPTTSFTIESYRKLADQLQWRLNISELAFNPNAYDVLKDDDPEDED